MSACVLCTSMQAKKVLEEEKWLDCGTPDNLLEAAIFASQGLLSPYPCNFKDNDPVIDGV